jgi:hypothetical protein
MFFCLLVGDLRLCMLEDLAVSERGNGDDVC